MNKPSDISKKLVIQKYLEQQIYSGNDTIIDRTNTVKYHVPKSGEVISNMIELFCTYAKKYDFKNSESSYISFIKELAEELGFEEQLAVNRFHRQYKEMKAGKIYDQSIYFMTAISSIIESFQNKVVQRLSFRLKRKFPMKDNTTVLKSLETFSQTSNLTYSLLINIEILKEMSRLVGVQMEPIMTDELQQKLVNELKEIWGQS
ncbi:MAG: hypothetical protein ACFFAJ_00390 [Candidatus Hodarchaeota archaeon]